MEQDSTRDATAQAPAEATAQPPGPSAGGIVREASQHLALLVADNIAASQARAVFCDAMRGLAMREPIGLTLRRRTAP